MPRSKQFKPEQALSSAMSAFWRHGYEATSMEDLMDCMGIGRASIYNAFGNKRALFLAALEHYVSNGGALQGARLPESEAGDPVGIRTSHRTGGDRRVVRWVPGGAALELAPHDEEIAQIVKQIFVGQETLFRSYLERAMACGEVPQTLDPSRTAQTLLALSIALLVLVRSRPDEPLLRSIEHQVRTLLR